MTLPLLPIDLRPARHTFITLSTAGWGRVFDQRVDLASNAVIREWAAAGLPVIARIAAAHERARVAVGIALPPAHGKARIPLTVQTADVDHWSAPPLLSEAMHTAPAAWRETIDALLLAAECHHVEVRVFGSLAWQSLTGLSYLSASSDIDLLWSTPQQSHFQSLLDTIAAIDRAAPMSVDGEVVFSESMAGNWRELHARPDEVIVKGPDGLTLLKLATLERALP